MWKIIGIVLIAGAVLMSLLDTVSQTQAKVDQSRAVECAITPELPGCDDYATAAGEDHE